MHMFVINPYSLGWLKDQCNKFLVGINELEKIIRSITHPMSKSMHCLPLPLSLSPVLDLTEPWVLLLKFCFIHSSDSYIHICHMLFHILSLHTHPSNALTIHRSTHSLKVADDIQSVSHTCLILPVAILHLLVCAWSTKQNQGGGAFRRRVGETKSDNGSYRGCWSGWIRRIVCVVYGHIKFRKGMQRWGSQVNRTMSVVNKESI